MLKYLSGLPNLSGRAAGEGRGLAGQLVPMLEQKKRDDKGYFFKLGSVQRSEKWYFGWEKGTVG